MAEFKHPDIGSIRCPYHNQRESFTTGHIIQPLDTMLVRYPCGYVDGLAPRLGMEPTVPVPGRDELVTELSKRLMRLEERQVPRRTPPRTEPPTRPSKGGVAV
mgnify:CR=1 FL=1